MVHCCFTHITWIDLLFWNQKQIGWHIPYRFPIKVEFLFGKVYYCFTHIIGFWWLTWHFTLPLRHVMCLETHRGIRQGRCAACARWKSNRIDADMIWYDMIWYDMIDIYVCIYILYRMENYFGKFPKRRKNNPPKNDPPIIYIYNHI